MTNQFDPDRLRELLRNAVEHISPDVPDLDAHHDAIPRRRNMVLSALVGFLIIGAGVGAVVALSPSSNQTTAAGPSPRATQVASSHVQTPTGSASTSSGETTVNSPSASDPRSETSSPTETTEACLASDIGISMSDAQPDGTHSYRTELRLGNAGSGNCQVQGYISLDLSGGDGASLPIRPIQIPSESDAELSQLQQLVQNEAAPVPAGTVITIRPGDYVAVVVEVHTADVCDTKGTGQDTSWRIGGADIVGNITLAHIDTPLCSDSFIFISPVMPPGENAAPASLLPTPTQSPDRHEQGTS